MNSVDVNTKLIEGYISLMKNMSAENKLDLISKLTNSVRSGIQKKNHEFYSSFGGWDEKQSADELIQTIKASRIFNRKVEEF